MDKFEKLSSKPWLSGPTRQHFVPKFYLEGFTSRGWLAVFDRASGELRKQRPKNVAVVSNLYTFEDKQDRKRFDLEVLFGQIESAGAPILKSLVEGKRISSEDRETFSIFLGIAAVRTPAAIAEASSVYAGFVKANSYLTLTDETRVFDHLLRMEGADVDHSLLKEQASAVAKMAREESYDVQVDHGYSRSRSLKVWHIVAKELLKRDWMILHAPEDGQSFLTSDSPVVLMSRSTATRNLPIGYGSPHAQILFPLTSKYALVASGSLGRTGRCDIKVDDLRRFNMNVAQNCHKHVMGSDAALLESITTELGLAGTEWQPKSYVEIERFVNANGSVTPGASVKRKGL
ncbi:DUF4238 domain-containing protein [Pseudomonas laurylsulfatiphila]|uniref:DUF4238 domain-containing protein n=1 Tax=Pseudomonas laurylsulfatiphila TaxID=2011015 RepID=UPI00215EEF58|nr:DUF4238 domain-containing protein [Pseudomonas laurylsulfatiphila]UVM07110.1 DUF4238 domain-containing protein [Pseudomonas laurylsulfatiphila]